MTWYRVAWLLTAVTIGAVVYGAAAPTDGRADGNDSDIWDAGQGRGTPRFELTDAEVQRLLDQIRKTDPKKADEIEKLRTSDPDQFQEEIRSQAREEFGKILRERMEAWRARRREEFIEWLKKSYPQESEELARLNANEDAYRKKFELLRGKYMRIYEEERRNPEMAEVLKEDLELQKRRDQILTKLKDAKSDRDKARYQAELEEVVGRRFDLIVRRKQIAYEQLLKRIEDLKRQLSESRGEIARWRDQKFKEDNVKERIKDLTGGGKFRWD